jgi:hypothetical protein
MGAETSVGLHVKRPLLLSDFNQNMKYVDKCLQNSPSIKFDEDPTGGSLELLYADGQTWITGAYFQLFLANTAIKSRET